MEIKVQCDCGTRYAFEVEPVHGQMPYAVNCPQCGADGTLQANARIAAVSTDRPRVRIHLPGNVPVAVPVAAIPDAPELEVCKRHPKNIAASSCVVCQKPICLECMEAFGYLCSINCRYQAEQQGIPLPVYEFQRSVASRRSWQHMGGVFYGILTVLVLLAALWIWYSVSLSKPRPFYAIATPKAARGALARFLDPNHVLFLNRESLSLHDVRARKPLWSSSLGLPKKEKIQKPKNLPKGSKFDFDEEYEEAPPHYFVAESDIWVCLPQRLQSYDRSTGQARKTIPIEGPILNFSTNQNVLWVVSAPRPDARILTRIDPGSGATARHEIPVAASRAVRVADFDSSLILPTPQVLLERELAEVEPGLSLDKIHTEIIASGEELSEFKVNLLEPHVSTVASVKPQKGPSKLNARTSASSNVGSIAEEVFNDMARSRGGGVKRVDESRYVVSLRRLNCADAPPWQGESIGPAGFFPQRSVDVIAAGKNLVLVDKKNAKIAETKLSYPVSARFLGRYQEGNAVPCVESGKALYFFDQGVLTAFELPSGAIQRRLPSVGISKLQVDNQGMLYVSTTSASPDDIQYSDQIKIGGGPASILMKVDPKTGKILWKTDQAGDVTEISGKYLYAVKANAGGMGLAGALAAAEGVEVEATGHFRIYRLDPGSGKILWEYYRRGVPHEAEFQGNTILLRYDEKLELLKFL